jgi:hypothetical protein
VNLAGRPSKVGGTVASVAGWSVLTVGLSVALGIGLLLGLIFTVGVALAVSGPVAIVVLVAGIALVASGRSLRRSGSDAQRTTREQGLLALIEHQGAATAMDGARVIGVTVGEADGLMTELAKRLPDRIAVDVDDQGLVWFRASSLAGARVRVGEDLRVEAVVAEEEPGGAVDQRSASRRARE